MGMVVILAVNNAQAGNWRRDADADSYGKRDAEPGYHFHSYRFHRGRGKREAEPGYRFGSFPRVTRDADAGYRFHSYRFGRYPFFHRRG